MREFFPQSSARLSCWKFNGEFGRNFATLFDLQMWCLGCDIRREHGNLLIDYGFQRSRPAQQGGGSSHYFKKIDLSHELHLWGFAIVVTAPHCGLCLRRYERTPTFTSDPELSTHLWRPQDLPFFSVPTAVAERNEARHLLALCASELSKYESLVEAVEGPRYRAGCYSSMRKGKRVKGILLKEAWRELRERLDAVESAAGNDVCSP